MRFAPKAAIVNVCLELMVQKQPLTTLRKPQAAVAAARSVSVSHQLVRMVLKTLENSRKK